MPSRKIGVWAALAHSKRWGVANRNKLLHLTTVEAAVLCPHLSVLDGSPEVD